MKVVHRCSVCPQLGEIRRPIERLWDIWADIDSYLGMPSQNVSLKRWDLPDLGLNRRMAQRRA